MRVLVTGGAGFIGSHIVEHYQGKADVVVLDNLRTGRIKNLKGFRVDFHEGSILDLELLHQIMKGVDYVFHLAAMVSVPESMANPIECVHTNTIGTLNVLAAAAEANVKKLCFSSSCAVYGDSPENPKHEDMLPQPKSPYSETKLAGEHYCSMYDEQGWLKTACLRYFNVFGPRQDPTSVYAAAIPIFANRALSGKPLTIFGDGKQTRDFINVKDVVAANVFLAEHPEATGAFNTGSGRSITIEELAEGIVHYLQSDSPIEFAGERPGDIRHSSASIDKFRALGWQPAVDFNTGLHQTLDFFRRTAQ